MTAVRTSKLGHIVLRVRDLARSERFYTEVLGLRKTGEARGMMSFFSVPGNSDSHDLALMRVGSDAPDPDPRGVGLYHFAYQVESEEALTEAYRALREADVPVVGTADHGVSKGIYILDPDGIEIEITYDLPPEARPQDAEAFATNRPLALG